MMNNIFSESWHKYVPCLQHFVIMRGHMQRNKFRCYNILRAYGAVSLVKDNGNSILESIKEKTFQPFFTTKPPGQGTGLGLSLSYDIVKAHGGDLRVATKEREGSEFIIQLRIN